MLAPHWVVCIGCLVTRKMWFTHKSQCVLANHGLRIQWSPMRGCTGKGPALLLLTLKRWGVKVCVLAHLRVHQPIGPAELGCSLAVSACFPCLPEGPFVSPARMLAQG